MNTDPRIPYTDAPASTATDTPPRKVSPKPSVSESMKSWVMSPLAFQLDKKGSLLALTALLLAIIILTSVVLGGLLTTPTVWTPVTWDFSLELPFDWPWDKPENDDPPASAVTGPFADGAQGNVLLALPDAANNNITESNLNSDYAVLADLSTGEVIASRNPDVEMYPASLTKVMTLIVAVENLKNENSLQEPITVSEEVYNRMKSEGASGVGMLPGEIYTVESMLYALMLWSDGIAACELAIHVAGSEAAFIELMNQKAESMGLTHTHFENPTGLHHPSHKSTAREMATIMAYAMNMSVCRRIMLQKTTPITYTKVNGAEGSFNLNHRFLVKNFDEYKKKAEQGVESYNVQLQPTRLTVKAAKTGWTGNESGKCLVTYAEDQSGKGYVCVTAKASDGSEYVPCIVDYVYIYDEFVSP